MPEELTPQTFGTQTDVASPGPSQEPVTTSDVGGGGSQQAAVEQNFVRSYLAEHGVNQSAFPDDRAALDTLRGAAEQYFQNRELLPHVQDYLANAQQYQTWRQQQQQVQQETEAKAAADKKFKWDAKKYNPSWAEHVQRDENGRLRPVNLADPTHLKSAQEYGEYQNWQRSTLDRLLSEFPTLSRDAVSEYVQEQIGQAVQGLQQNWQSQQQMASIYQANQGWLSQREGDQVLYDQNGRPVFSELGQQYLGHLQNLPQMNLSDPRVQDWLAQRLTIADQNANAIQAALAGQGGQTAQPQETSAGRPFTGTPQRGPDGKFLPAGENGKQKQDRFLDRARGTYGGPNRDAASGSDEADDLLGPKEIMLREFKKNGIPVHG